MFVQHVLEHVSSLVFVYRLLRFNTVFIENVFRFRVCKLTARDQRKMLDKNMVGIWYTYRFNIL